MHKKSLPANLAGKRGLPFGFKTSTTCYRRRRAAISPEAANPSSAIVDGSGTIVGDASSTYTVPTFTSATKGLAKI